MWSDDYSGYDDWQDRLIDEANGLVTSLLTDISSLIGVKDLALKVMEADRHEEIDVEHLCVQEGFGPQTQFIIHRGDRGQFNNLIHSFYMSRFPGCCGAVVSHNAHTNYSFRKKGIHKRAHAFKADLATLLDYGLIVATGITTATAKTMSGTGWKETDSFNNPRSGNNVHVYIKELHR